MQYYDEYFTQSQSMDEQQQKKSKKALDASQHITEIETYQPSVPDDQQNT